MRAPVKAAYVIRFFQLVTEKQVTEAERELLRIKEKIERTEWNHGYYRALQGMLISRRTNSDNPAFLTTLDTNNKRALLDLKREFQEKVESRLYTDYDRGFFSAWADYVSTLKRMNFTPASTVQTAQPQPIIHPETVEETNDQTQASLASWQEEAS
jgi:hypothetical protein